MINKNHAKTEEITASAVEAKKGVVESLKKDPL
jgi:hypothetical protein